MSPAMGDSRQGAVDPSIDTLVTRIRWRDRTMATLLAPAPTGDDRIVALEHRQRRDQRDRTLVADIVAEAFNVAGVGQAGRTVPRLEREARWVCEWWPPD